MKERYRLLIVEDSHDLRIIWRKLFESTPYRPRFCETAGMAMEMAGREGLPDVLISDYFLPDMNGIDLASQVRKTYGLCPFILVTGNRDESVLTTIKNMPHSAYLQKPVRFKVLLEKVQEMLRNLVASDSSSSDCPTPT